MLIAKLYAYGFDKIFLYFSHSYLSQRKQGTKINTYYSTCVNIHYGVPNGSILGPLLFSHLYLLHFLWYGPPRYCQLCAREYTACLFIKLKYYFGEIWEGYWTYFQLDFKQLSKVSKPVNRLNPGKCHLITTSKEETEVAISNSLIKNEKSKVSRNSCWWWLKLWLSCQPDLQKIK